MCKITEFELDEALETVKSHAPNVALLIEKYIQQLRSDKAEFQAALRNREEMLEIYREDVNRALLERIK